MRKLIEAVQVAVVTSGIARAVVATILETRGAVLVELGTLITVHAIQVAGTRTRFTYAIKLGWACVLIDITS